MIFMINAALTQIFFILPLMCMSLFFGTLENSAFACFLLQEYQELLIKCISQELGFFSGKPVAACLIYKCLVQWRSFEVERTSIFDRVIQTIGSAIEVIKPIFKRICVFYLLWNFAHCSFVYAILLELVNDLQMTFYDVTIMD